MKSKHVLLSGILTLAVATGSLAQQQSATIGKEPVTNFQRQNKQGAQAVGAVKPTGQKLSTTDQALMLEVAQGGMMQLELSKMAVQMAKNPEVQQLAQAEVEEQTGLAAKLQEIAKAKGVNLPPTPDAKTQAMVAKMKATSGASFDRMYVQESGVKNHQVLDQTLARVEANAKDDALKNVAKAAHPLVKTHLKVSQQVLDKIGK